MTTSDETVTTSLRLEAAQMLKTLAEVNAKAGSIPQILKNVESALDSFSKKFGISFGAAQRNMKDTIVQAENLRALLKNPVTASLVSAKDLPVAGAENPFKTTGLSTQAGLKAMNDQRAKGLALQAQQAKSEAGIAKEINEAKAAEDRKAASKANVLRLQQEEKRLLMESRALRDAEHKSALLNRTAQSRVAYADKQKLEPPNIPTKNLNEADEATRRLTGSFVSLVNSVDKLRGTSAKIQAVAAGVKKFAQENSIGFAEAKKKFMDFDASMDRSGKTSAFFGGAGQEAWKKVGDAAVVAGNKTKTASQNILHGLNVVRLAAGILASMLIRDLAMAIVQTFKDGVEYATKFELALYNLTNAERILSKQGTEIAPEDLSGIIDNLQKLLPTLSRMDATNAVSQIAIFTKGLGLSKEQIEQLAQATAVLAVKNRAAGLSFQQVFDQLKTGLLTGTTRGITDLGININGAGTKLIAMKMAGVETEEQFNKLNATVQEQYQAQAILAQVYEQTTDELGTIDEYLETNDAKIQKNKASWSDLFGVIGRGIANLIPDVTGVVDWATKSVELGKLNKLFVSQIDPKKFDLSNLTINTKLGLGIALTRKEYEKLKETLSSLSQEEILNIFPDPSAIKDRFTRELVESLIEVEDTATNTAAAMQNAFEEIDLSGAKDELKDLLKDLENLQERMDDKQEDFDVDLARFDQDASLDRQRVVEDYNLNVLQATRAFNTQRREANQKYRQKEQEDERKFQENMRKLQEDFLYNLEDALRERDARQVLRLIDKYNMEKEAMINENSIRREASAENHAIEQQEQRAQLEERLRVMAEEQAIKLQRMDQDSALKRDRMEEDHLLEMSRLREQMDERILEAANKMAEELGLNQEGAQAIYDLLQQYYGTDGSLAALTSGGYAAMLANAEGFLGGLMGIVGQYQAVMSSMAGTPIPIPSGASTFFSGGAPRTAPIPLSPSLQRVPMFAEGGRFITTRPTQFIAGEAGAEMVTVTPLSQIMDSTSNITGQAGTRGANGQTQISVMVDLSPDLEARVVDNALEGASNVIAQVRRAKR